MAFLTAKGIAGVAINLLTPQLVLARTATRVPGSEFTGDNGDTITLRVPQPETANTDAPGTSLSASTTVEVPVDVQIGHVYNLKNLTDTQLSMEIADFARQVTAVQVASVATGVENKVATALNDLAVNIEFASSASDADTRSTILEAREILAKDDVPPSDRWLAVSPSIATRMLEIDELTKVNEAGSSSALRDAMLGRYFGFNVVESSLLTNDTAVAYHRSGLALAVRQPQSPRGATESFGITQDGYGLRQVFQYDASTAQDQSLISTFAGAAAVPDAESPSEQSPGESEGEDDYPRLVKIGVGS